MAPIARASTLLSSILLVLCQSSALFFLSTATSRAARRRRPLFQTPGIRDDGHLRGPPPAATPSDMDPSTRFALRSDESEMCAPRQKDRENESGDNLFFSPVLRSPRRWSAGIWWQIAPTHPWLPRPPPWPLPPTCLTELDDEGRQRGSGTQRLPPSEHRLRGCATASGPAEGANGRGRLTGCHSQWSSTCGTPPTPRQTSHFLR